MRIPISQPTCATPTCFACSIHRHSVEAAAKPCKTVSRDEMIGRCAVRLLVAYYRGTNHAEIRRSASAMAFNPSRCWACRLTFVRTSPRARFASIRFDQSKIFPGTVRDYWIYVPKQYDPAKPACLYVNQDGIQYNAPAGLRRADPQEGDAGHDRRVRHARPGQGPLRPGARSVQSQSTSTTVWATTTSGSCSRSCCPRSRRRRRPTAGRSSCRATATTAASPVPAAARSARSRRPGSGPMRSAASSARSAPMSACAAAMSIRP